MQKMDLSFGWVLLALLSLIAAACSSPAGQVAGQETFSTPFAYCAAVGSIDQPDARYTGEAVPDAVIQGYKKAAGLESSSMPVEQFKKSTFWRCMDRQVYACNVGANLPCESKANASKTPTQEMADYCKANPNSDFIPAAVTGRETIYSWRCVKETPEVLEQVSQVDKAGYLANIWYKIEEK